MMNLEKMKQRKRFKGRLKKGLLAATTIFCVMQRNTMKSTESGDMMICQSYRNAGNTKFWKVQRSSSEY